MKSDNRYLVLIGAWHERTAREIRSCPSYYAADYETLRTLPGDFELHLRFKCGYRDRVPTPDEVLVNIAAERVDGRLYDGFCGVIIGSTPLPVGERVIHPEGHRVGGLRDLIESGCITLRSDFGWLLYDKPWERPDAPRTWEAVEALSGNTPIRAHGAALTSNAAAVICQSESIAALNVLEPTWDPGKLDPTR